MTKHITAQEGGIYAIPLRVPGYGVGVVALAGRGAVLVVHLLHTFLAHPDQFNPSETLSPRDSLAIVRTGPLGIRDGSWIKLGFVSGWDQNDWRVVNFVRYEELTGRSYLVEYDAENPSRLIAERVIPPGVREHGPSDDLMGHKYVEGMLTRLLDSEGLTRPGSDSD